METVKVASLITLLIFISDVNCQADEACTFTGWNFEQVPCPDGTIEMYRESDGKQEIRFCCNPEHPDYKDYRNAANTCRTTACHSSSVADLCGTLDPRYINNGDTQLGYEEILRESCAKRNGEGVIAACCVKNSTEGLLATTLGAERNEFPHQAKLRLPGHCGGTVYNSKFLLTSAHCIVGKESGEVKSPEGMEVILGSNIGDIDSKENVYKVKNLIPHPQYSWLKGSPELQENPQGPRIFNDIGLMELDREIKFGPKVKALEIAPKDFNPLSYSDKAVIVGWGTTDTLDVSVHLQKSNFLIRSDQSCFINEEGPHSEMKGMENQLLCVGGIFEKWSPTAGGGDSGGPAICRGPNETAVACGVTSYGGDDERCVANQNQEDCIPSVYAEVSFFHDWIKENAGEQDPNTLYKPFLYGKTLELEQHMHQVYIGSSEGKACGGTLISPDLAITAAQCIARSDGSAEPFNDILITVGMNDLNDWGKSYPIKSLTVLPGFVMDGEPVDIEKQGIRVIIADNFYKNDLAVIKLESPTDITQFPLLPEGSNNDMSQQVGREMSFPRNTTYSARMMEREFRFIQDCQKRMNRMARLGMNITIDENLLCGVESYSGGSSCDRELGGGIICTGNNGEDVLCGVQVFRLCELSIPNGFIDMSAYSSWVKEVMKTL